MSNLFENANYQNVLDGYEKIYDDNGNLELENIYKNGELVDTKEYDIEKNILNKNDNYISSVNNNQNIVDNTNKESNNLNNNDNSSYILPLLIISVLVLIFIITMKSEFTYNVSPRSAVQ